MCFFGGERLLDDAELDLDDLLEFDDDEEEREEDEELDDDLDDRDEPDEEVDELLERDLLRLVLRSLRSSYLERGGWGIDGGGP